MAFHYKFLLASPQPRHLKRSRLHMWFLLASLQSHNLKQNRLHMFFSELLVKFKALGMRLGWSHFHENWQQNTAEALQLHTQIINDNAVDIRDTGNVSHCSH